MRYRRQQWQLVLFRNRRPEPDARVQMQHGVQRPHRQQYAQHQTTDDKVQESQAALLPRQGRRFLDLDRETLLFLVEVHGDTRVFTTPQQILINIAVNQITTREFGKRRFTAMHASASFQFLRQFPLGFVDARAEHLDIGSRLRQFLLELLVQWIVDHTLVNHDLAVRLGDFTPRAFFDDGLVQVLDLMTDLDYVRISFVITHPQRFQARLQFRDAGTELAFAREDRGNFRLARELLFKRVLLDLRLFQVLGRLLDSRPQLIQSRADIRVAARTRIEVGGTEILQLLFCLDELAVIFLGLLVNEVERRLAFRRLGAKAFRNEKIGIFLRRLEGTLRIIIPVLNPDNVLADAGDRRSFGELLDYLVLLRERRIASHPAGILEDLVHDLAPEDELAR